MRPEKCGEQNGTERGTQNEYRTLIVNQAYLLMIYFVIELRNGCYSLAHLGQSMPLANGRVPQNCHCIFRIATDEAFSGYRVHVVMANPITLWC